MFAACKSPRDPTSLVFGLDLQFGRNGYWSWEGSRQEGSIWPCSLTSRAGSRSCAYPTLTSHRVGPSRSFEPILEFGVNLLIGIHFAV